MTNSEYVSALEDRSFDDAMNSLHKIAVIEPILDDKFVAVLRKISSDGIAGMENAYEAFESAVARKSRELTNELLRAEYRRRFERKHMIKEIELEIHQEGEPK